jgi:hypothetical protein
MWQLRGITLLPVQWSEIVAGASSPIGVDTVKAVFCKYAVRCEDRDATEIRTTDNQLGTEL